MADNKKGPSGVFWFVEASGALGDAARHAVDQSNKKYRNQNRNK